MDIFFVLSGFLITSIIFSDLAKNHFSIRDFFLRRAKRILPALILVLLISSFFAYIFFIARQFGCLCKDTFIFSVFYF
ncbi:Acyltransferase 3 [Yersinia enterocolitica subsp. palearctica 105.5R(r)]|nr:Acyltransferase 3 [Yersinia enterocolitica subsp. palearctica 105.5R(r)]